MNNKKYVAFAIFALVLLSGLASASTTFSMNIWNNQTTTTAVNLPQKIFFNPANTLFNGLGRPDLGNIRFYAGSTLLNSWCESNCNETSGNTIFWVNMSTFTITSNSNRTINMTFEATSTQYDGVHAGEAPQLTATYGLYDNGNHVFLNYVNFSANMAPSNFNYEYGIGNFNFGNGFLLNGGIGNQYYGLSSTFTINPQTEIEDAYGYLDNSSYVNSAGFGLLTAQGDPYDTGSINIYCPGGGYVYHLYDHIYYGGGDVATASSCGSADMDVLTLNETTLHMIGVVNYADITALSDGFTPETALYVTFNACENACSGNPASTLFINWARTRYDPPNGVMPAFDFGTVTTTTSTSTTSTTSTTTSTTSTSSTTSVSTTTTITSTSTSTIPTTTSTTSTATTTTSTAGSTTTIPQFIPNFNMTGNEQLLNASGSSFNNFFGSPFNIIPYFSYMLLILAFGITYVSSKKISTSFLLTAIVSYLIFGALTSLGTSVNVISISICGLVTIAFVMSAWYETHVHHPK